MNELSFMSMGRGSFASREAEFVQVSLGNKVIGEIIVQHVGSSIHMDMRMGDRRLFVSYDLNKHSAEHMETDVGDFFVPKTKCPMEVIS